MLRNSIRNLTVALIFPLFAFSHTLYATAESLQIGNSVFERVSHHEDVTGPDEPFGALLYDTDGRLVKHDGNKTWMYTGLLNGSGHWASYARQYDLDTVKTTTDKTLVLTPLQGERWGMIHLALKVADNVYLAFYSNGSSVRAAVGTSPNGPFTVDPNFNMSANSQGWEQGCSLESDGGMVKIHENDSELRFWMLYDSLKSDTSGHNGWAEIRFDKNTKAVSLVQKHPNNPLPLLLPNHLAARTGGNIDSSVRIDGKYPLFYLSKKNVSTYNMAVALSDDPLFQTIDANAEFDGPLGSELAIEKFQFYGHNDSIFVIYENCATDNHLTCVREYRLVPEPGSLGMLIPPVIMFILMRYVGINNRSKNAIPAMRPCRLSRHK